MNRPIIILSMLQDNQRNRSGYFLHRFSKLPQTQNELSLKLEQMRALDNDLPLHVLELTLNDSWGIDTEEDLLKLREHFASN